MTTITKAGGRLVTQVQAVGSRRLPVTLNPASRRCPRFGASRSATPNFRDPELWRSISHQRKIVRTVEVLRLEVVACRETRAPRETAAGYS